MAKSNEHILFGVRGYEEKRGTVHPERWAKLRTVNSPNSSGFGTMSTPEGMIIWFNDPIARDEFQTVFGGVHVTLTRKIEVVVGKKAAELARRMKA